MVKKEDVLYNIICNAKLVFSFFLLFFLSSSCSFSKKDEDIIEYLEIYYFVGFIDTERSCEKDFDISEVADQGVLTIEKEDYDSIKNYIVNSNIKDQEYRSTYGMCLQCNLHNKDSVIRFSVGQFGPMIIDGKTVQRNDKLVYLLRKNSGFYNYYRRDELIDYCEEVKLFGIPDNYIDLSDSPSSSSKLYAKLVLKPK